MIARGAEAAAAVMDMDGIKEIVYRINQVVNWLIIFLFAFLFLNTDREVMMMGIMALTRCLSKKNKYKCRGTDVGVVKMMMMVVVLVAHCLLCMFTKLYIIYLLFLFMEG